MYHKFIVFLPYFYGTFSDGSRTNQEPKTQRDPSLESSREFVKLTSLTVEASVKNADSDSIWTQQQGRLDVHFGYTPD